MRKRITIEDAQNVAESRGGKCLSTEYYNSYHKKMLWSCKNGHVWRTQYRHIREGHWCPQCGARKAVTQKRLFNIINNFFPNNNVCFNFTDFDWLSGQEIDIFVEGIGLGIEYDGQQHFEPIEFWGGQETFDKVKKRDIEKNKKISAHPEDIKFFIRFNYKEDINQNYVIAKLKKYGVKI